MQKKSSFITYSSKSNDQEEDYELIYSEELSNLPQLERQFNNELLQQLQNQISSLRKENQEINQKLYQNSQSIKDREISLQQEKERNKILAQKLENFQQGAFKEPARHKTPNKFEDFGGNEDKILNKNNSQNFDLNNSKNNLSLSNNLQTNLANSQNQSLHNESQMSEYYEIVDEESPKIVKNSSLLNGELGKSLVEMDEENEIKIQELERENQILRVANIQLEEIQEKFKKDQTKDQQQINLLQQKIQTIYQENSDLRQKNNKLIKQGQQEQYNSQQASQNNLQQQPDSNTQQQQQQQQNQQAQNTLQNLQQQLQQQQQQQNNQSQSEIQHQQDIQELLKKLEQKEKIINSLRNQLNLQQVFLKNLDPSSYFDIVYSNFIQQSLAEKTRGGAKPGVPIENQSIKLQSEFSKIFKVFKNCLDKEGVVLQYYFKQKHHVKA